MFEKISFGEFNGDRDKIEEIKNKNSEFFVLGNIPIENLNGKFKFICGFTTPDYKFYFAFGSMKEFPEHKHLFLELQRQKDLNFQFRKGGRISFEEVEDNKILVKIFGFSVTYGRFNVDVLQYFSEKLKMRFEELYPNKQFEIEIEEKI